MLGIDRWTRRILSRLGISVQRIETPPDLEPEFLALHNDCAPFTMTSIERMYGLYSALKYVVSRKVAGDFVECGVWRGGSSMLMARVATSEKEQRRIWLYDTFAGMTEPSDKDRDFGDGDAQTKWEASIVDGASEWCKAELASVRANMAQTGYPEHSLRFVVGPVEETLRVFVPERIALLRLDTDWYESTRVELEVLYPLLSVGGVLIVDDYGHWKGARQAVDEYFCRLGAAAPLLQRLDYTGRMAVKTTEVT